MIELGIVVIGRNEGERLLRCLKSVAGGGMIVYVDSGSTDGSPDAARAAGAIVVDLDRSIPFTAARARNQGFQKLLEMVPNARFVQFVDGDCEIAPGWLDQARRALNERPELAAICGRLRERHPQHSIYNRLCDLEWNGPVGEVKSCGGIALYRISDFRRVGGFDPTVPAGEEPELCSRLRGQGKKIVRLSDEMGWHDAAMLRFSQWWRRAVRAGYGGLDVAVRFERARGGGGFTRQIRSARVWGLAWPLLVLLAGVGGWLWGGAAGALMGAGLIALLLPAQTLRIALRARRLGASPATSLAYGVATLIAKWASLVGQWRWWMDHRAGRNARLIEHKAVPVNGGAP